MEYIVTFIVEALDGQAAADQVAIWIVTPGSILQTIYSTQPEAVLTEARRIGEDGVIGEIKKALDSDRPSIVPPHLQIPPPSFDLPITMP